MKYPMTDEDKQKFEDFLTFADNHGEGSLTHAVQAFIADGEQDLEQRRKRALYIATLASNIGIYAFNALEEASREYPEGQTEQIFELRRMKSLNKELASLTSAATYEAMTNQSAMRKVFSALTDFMNNAYWDRDTAGKTRSEYREEIRKVQAEFNDLMAERMCTEFTDPKSAEINEKLMELENTLDEMDRAWRRMKRS